MAGPSCSVMLVDRVGARVAFCNVQKLEFSGDHLRVVRLFGGHCFAGACVPFPGGCAAQHTRRQRGYCQRWQFARHHPGAAQHHQANHMRRAQPAEDRPLEQQVAQQVQRRAAQHRQRRPFMGMAHWMRQHELIGHRPDDDAGHQHHVDVGVGQPCKPARIGRMRHGVRAALGNRVEVQPPHRQAADERQRHRRDVFCGPVEPGKRGARDQHRFAQRDDDEQRAALGHVAAFHVPVIGGGAAEARRVEAHRRPDPFDGQRDDPAGPAHGTVRQPARQPQHRRDAEPRGDALEVAPHGQRLAAHGPQEEHRAPELHEHIGERKRQPARAERLRQRCREQQPARHQHEHQHADGELVRVEPVRHPRREDPHPPHRQHQQQRLRAALEREVADQQ
ncbi:hypothetical protein COLO4_01462, partial [Corchorus olitorius]